MATFEEIESCCLIEVRQKLALGALGRNITLLPGNQKNEITSRQ